MHETGHDGPLTSFYCPSTQVEREQQAAAADADRRASLQAKSQQHVRPRPPLPHHVFICLYWRKLRMCSSIAVA